MLCFHAEAEEHGGEEDDACPGEDLRRPWGVAFAPDHFHFVDDGDGVGGGDAEGVVEQAVAVFRAGGLDEQGVGDGVGSAAELRGTEADLNPQAELRA